MCDQPWSGLRDPLSAFDPEDVDSIREDLLQGDLIDDWLWTAGVGSTLRNGVFHVTGLDGWAGIKASRAILPNRGDRPFTFEKSRVCRGLIRNGVCLFDFASPCVEIVAGQWDRCARTIFCSPERNSVDGRDGLPIVVIHFAEREKLPGPWEYWRRTEPSIDDCVPYVECWHLAPMPLTAATAVHVVRPEERRWRSYSADSVPDRL